MILHATNVNQMVRHLLFALVMGCVGAGASIVLCLCVDNTLKLFMANPWLAAILPATVLGSLGIYRIFKLDLDLTTHKAVHDMRANLPIPALLTPGILLGTCLSTIGGASVGKEAGALQMGASLGNFVAKPFKLSQVLTYEKKHDLYDYTAAVGMAATFAALFFSPLAATFLILELCRYRASITRHIFTIMPAAFVGSTLASLIGIGDILPKVAIPPLNWVYVGKSLIVGVCCALIGALYAFGIDWIQRHTIAIKKNYWLWVGIGGSIIALLMLAFPWSTYAGGGDNLIALALENRQGDWDFAIKGLLTVLALGFWFRGGEIMPTFTTGALLGASCCIMTGDDAGFSAALGIMAFFTAVVRAPLASFFMGCEMFGWAMSPYFAIAVAIAYSVGGDMGIYGLGVASSIQRLGNHLQQKLGNLPGGIIIAHAPETFSPLEVKHSLTRFENTMRNNEQESRYDNQAREKALAQAGTFEQCIYRLHETLEAIEEAMEEGGSEEPTSKLPGTK